MYWFGMRRLCASAWKVLASLVVLECVSFLIGWSMEIAPVPALKSPILITDGNAVLTDDDQILDFHGTFAAAFSQKDNCVRCVDGVFAGTSDSIPVIKSLLFALQYRQ